MQRVGVFLLVIASSSAAQCTDQGGSHNFCTEWCNVPGKWGCGTASDGNYTCSCAGCNGCAVAQCVDKGGTHNYCSQWCNTPGRWGCGTPSDSGYTCSCAGCNGCPSSSPTPKPVSPTPKPVSPTPAPAPAGDKVEFLALGDFGFGNSNQKAVGSVMTSLAKKHGLDYVVSVGDNIYQTGVSSTTDTQWKSKWSDIYSGPLMDVTWYAVLGNHDWKGTHVHAEIDKGRQGGKWYMPDFFYTRKHKVGNATVAWVHLDTNLLHYGVNGQTSQMKANFKQYGFTNVTAHLVKAEELLKSVQGSTWIFVVGHMMNVGYVCGKVGAMPQLVPLFEKYKVDAYMAGHTHAVGYQKSVSGISYYLTGGGGQAAGLCGGADNADWALNSMGVLRGSLTETKFISEFYNQKGVMMHSHTQGPRK